ncbi:TonB-dependent receptor plug domain-containing protein [Pelagicoccus albus]|uniref:TonB-dependent receptor plug domain-containing protein n=1 Tax=Pelagicoccus albus TaxID=415222 RepID=A0A7X1E869_9BACT|nr:TonB-dependent receptor plug domain-containing protein [Pelagicoccus albus]MBC2604462.1 TonB-dependent receptor plug domain-containing protein [Pelagicoccus albus]
MTKTTPPKGTGYLLRTCLYATLGVSALLARVSYAQEEDEEDPEEIFELSPFEVTADSEQGYQATTTLAGTRIRTDLRDIASSISVVTKDFLEDTGSKNTEDLLVYTANTEVGGLNGNFGGMGNANGISETAALLRPSNNTRVRGLDSADNTRDYFQSEIPWDGYIVDRVDLQRGPNSILFGVGSPAGIINAGLQTASLSGDEKTYENRVDGFGSFRNSLNVNTVVLEDVLAVRVAALDDDTNYRQEEAYNNDNRFYAAIRYQPNLFKADGAQTIITANFEHGDIQSNRPRTLAPIDKISAYFDEDAIAQQSWDMYEAWDTVVPDNDTGEWNSWVDYYMARLGSSNPVFWYDQSTEAYKVIQSNASTLQGIGTDGTVDASIGGIPFGRNIGIAGYNQYSISADLDGAIYNVYKDVSLTDASVFDFYNHLIDGNNKKEWQEWESYNASFTQSFFNNRLAFRLDYDHQDYQNGQQGIFLGSSPYISVDINAYTAEYPAAYTDLAVENEGVGQAYIGSSSHYGNSTNHIIRDSLRFTAAGEIDFTEFMEDSALSDFLGYHNITGLWERSEKFTDSRSYVLYATDPEWAEMQGLSTSISDGARQIDWIYYLSDDLSELDSASGQLSYLTDTITIPTSTTVTYFDSTWKWSLDPTASDYVDPAAYWENPTDADNPDSTQSENPENYVGWTTTEVDILSADNGDIDQLYTNGSKTDKTIDSYGFTWQGHMLDNMIVPVFSWRHDKVTTQSANAPLGEYSVAQMDYTSSDGDTPVYLVSEGDTRSYGVVVHMPDSFRNSLPWGTDLSLTYNNSSNFNTEQRVGFDGSLLPNSQGESEDYGFVMETANGRLSMRANWYKTKVFNANLSGDSASSTLGSNTYYLYLLEGWGTASAVTNNLGNLGEASGLEWYWNWAYVDGGWDWDTYADPTSEAYLTSESTIAQQEASAAWIASMQSQAWYDAYGIDVDVAAIQAGDYATGMGDWSVYNGVGALQAAGAGKIGGLYPVATVDTESKGFELEMTARPTDNWNVSFNMSKTTATRTNLDAAFISYIEDVYDRFNNTAAGDLRLWWAGDKTIREYFNTNVYAAYLFQLDQDGSQAAEIRPWKFSLVQNYDFTEGRMKGAKVGMAYRWADAQILGYGLAEIYDEATGLTEHRLDVDQPFYGEEESAFDAWVGYSKPFENFDWSIQLNMKNIGENPHLVAISANPDGTAAAMRIVEGMTWQLTNTFKF